jgi:uncharacterized protein
MTFIMTTASLPSPVLQQRATEPVDPSRFISRTSSTVVMQPTTLCNLDCVYCYLPSRSMQRLMLPTVSDAVAQSIAAASGGKPAQVIWHCGEPLATPISHFRRLLLPFERARTLGDVVHGIQTNATLLDDAWCDLLVDFGVRVGVSIDGPPQLNGLRRDRAGRDSFDRSLRGINALRKAGLAFTAICVVSPETIAYVDDLVAFFAELGCTSVGFNLGESEYGARSDGRTEDVVAQKFWRRLFEYNAAGLGSPVRELDQFLTFIGHRRTGRHDGNLLIDPIPTVGYDGDVVVCSPELLGVKAPAYGDFVVGNVLCTPLPQILEAAMATRYVTEFASALHECAHRCEFYDFCGGAQAGNRYFEHGTFAVAETAYCRTTRQALVRAAADQMSKREEQRHDTPRNDSGSPQRGLPKARTAGPHAGR